MRPTSPRSGSALPLHSAWLAALLVPLLAAPPARAQEARPYRPSVDVLDYEIVLDLPDTGRAIEGRAVLTVRRTLPRDTLVLDLVGLRVDSVLVNEKPAAFARDAQTIRVALPAGAPDSLRVTVRYGGEVTDGLIIRTDSIGRWMGFGDNWPNRARYWIPSVDHPSDKATVTWIVRAPSDRRVVANGALLEEAPLNYTVPVGVGTVGSASGVNAGNGRAWLASAMPPGFVGRPRMITRWREARPIAPYLMVIAAAPLVYYDLGASACGHAEFPGCVRQSVYVAPEARDFLPGPFVRAGEIVDFFASLVAPFPYEKLAHVQSQTRFGGMENASAIFYADAPFRQRTMGVGVIAHETAHQWFGDAVTEREWGHLWLSEGFASYFEQLWVEHSMGASAFRDGMTELRTEVVRDTAVTRHRPVLDTAETSYLKLLNVNSYQKGAWVLHMLRSLVGDSAFFGGIRAYYTAHQHSTALTDDLRRAMEQASGQQLGWFFDQWLRRPGYPELRTGWRFDARAHRVVLQVEQGKRWAPFRFPLTVDVEAADGTTRRVTVDVPAARSAQLPLSLELTAAPTRVVFDPDVRLLATFAPR